MSERKPTQLGVALYAVIGIALIATVGYYFGPYLAAALGLSLR